MEGTGLPGEGVDAREVGSARARLGCGHHGAGATPDGWTQGEPRAGKRVKRPQEGGTRGHKGPMAAR